MKKSIYFYLVFTSVMPIFLRILRKILMARSTNNFWVVISFGQPFDYTKMRILSKLNFEPQ